MRTAIQFIIFSWLFVLAGNRSAANDFFSDGLAAAQSGDFANAAMAFDQATLQQKSIGGFVNLGIAEWQRGHAGKAILAWERALWIDPYDTSARQNLAFARNVTQVDVPELKWHEAASTWLSPNAWPWVTGAGLWIAVGALTLPGFFRRRKAGWHQWLAAVGLGVFLFGLVANMGVLSRTQLGFVTKRNAPLLLTPTDAGEILTSLSAGEPARKLKTRGEFYFVQTAGGQGWMKKTDIGLVAWD